MVVKGRGMRGEEGGEHVICMENKGKNVNKKYYFNGHDPLVKPQEWEICQIFLFTCFLSTCKVKSLFGFIHHEIN